MSQTLHQNDIHDLVQTGSATSTPRPASSARPRPPWRRAPGLVTRTRWSIGRRLVSIGQTVAGTHA